MCGHGEGGGDTGKKQKKVLHRGNTMILYNYCIRDLRDQGVHIYIYIYSINRIIQLYR